MTTPPEIQRKVSQLGHDVEDVYELVDITNKAVTTITGVQRRHGTRLEEIQQALDLHSGRLERIEDTQRKQTEKLDAILELVRGDRPIEGR